MNKIVILIGLIFSFITCNCQTPFDQYEVPINNPPLFINNYGYIEIGKLIEYNYRSTKLYLEDNFTNNLNIKTLGKRKRAVFISKFQVDKSNNIWAYIIKFNEEVVPSQTYLFLVQNNQVLDQLMIGAHLLNNSLVGFSHINSCINLNNHIRVIKTTFKDKIEYIYNIDDYKIINGKFVKIY